MQKPLISIVIPVYNAEKYLNECLKSVFAQTYIQIEIIIINDGSTDKSEKIIKKYLSDTRIKYLKQKNQGVAIARNLGIKFSKGDLIAFLDADDIWEKDKLSIQTELLKNNQIGLAYTNARFIGQGKRVNKKYSNYGKFYRGKVFTKLIIKNFTPLSSIVVRKKLLMKINGFSEDKKIIVGEDYDLLLKLSQICLFDYSSKILIQYRVSQKSLSSNKKQAYINLLYLYKKWIKNKNINFTQKILFYLSYLKTIGKIIIATLLKL